jgi:uncharacterized membrane protein YhaH (DUF805 family)
MGLGWILFGLNGRLNRKPYWIASIVLLVILIAVALTGAVVGGQMMNEAMFGRGSVETAQAVMTYPALVAALLVFYPAVAVMVKRFHDLGRSAKWVLLLLVPTLAKMASDFAGLTGQPIPVSQIGELSGDEGLLELWRLGIAAELRIRPAEFAVDAFNFVVGLWFFVWLGFFRGTMGPNDYGPDPRAAK